MVEEQIAIIEDDPPPRRPRWYCHEHPSGFDDVDEAVAWGLGRAPTVIIRTLGPVFYCAGDPPADREAQVPPLRPWPPSREQRAEIEARYEEEWRVADAREAAYDRYREARDEWLLERAPELLGKPPAHQCLIDVPGSGAIAFEEYDGSRLCSAWRDDTEVASFGAAAEVIGTTSGRELSDPWVKAVDDALARERTWRGRRRQHLEVTLGGGELFHVTAASNRDSIQRYGLDWTRMGGRGIAGSTAPELDAVFLCQSLQDAEFFTWMAVGRGNVDIWGVRVDSLVVESGPDGWWIVSERIPPERLRLAISELVPEPPRPTTSGTAGWGYMRISRRDDLDA